jgi:hypothetical protein
MKMCKGKYSLQKYLLVAVQNAEGLIALGMVHFQSFSPRTAHINSAKYSLKLFGDGARHEYFFTHNFDVYNVETTSYNSIHVLYVINETKQYTN